MAIKEKSEAEWQAEFDARTLADSEQIRGDAKRYAKAKKAAKGVAKDMQKVAKEQQARAAAINKIASGKEPKAKKPAPATRRAAKKKTAK